MRRLFLAKGCGIYKLICVFLLGGILGDLVETLFCMWKYHKFINRSSLVFGQFSVIWGLGFLLATLVYYILQNHDVRFLFAAGAVLGGIFEYFSSVCTEKMLGTIFWDYSKFRFNIAGRVSMVYCLGWGLAAIFWIRGVYPALNQWIDSIPVSSVTAVCNICMVVLILDGVISLAALKRYVSRKSGIAAGNILARILDLKFGNLFIERVYPFMKLV